MTQTMATTAPLKIAVVGGGIAGLTASYLLQRRHKVTLFEKSGRLGGNAFTYTTSAGQDVDIAAAAFGKAGYRHFYGLLHELGIETAACPNSYMSLHNLNTKKGLYLSLGLDALALRGREILHPRNLWTVVELLRGLRLANRLLASGALDQLSLAAALELVPPLSGDARLILLCTLCLMSSMSCSEVLDAPASFFFNKLRTHNDVISPKATYSVRCVRGFTRSYVNALADHFRGSIRSACEVTNIHRDQAGVQLTVAGEGTSRFDKIIFACNADQALNMLETPTDQEKRLLGVWKYKEGRVVVHADYSSFPQRELMQAYTFLYTEKDGRLETSVNGALWHEPGVPATCHYISTQHPNFPIRDELVEFETVLRTPLFDSAACATIAELPDLNGVHHTYYCGSHFGYGLHNDAVRSAMDVATALDAPFLLPSRGAMRRRAFDNVVRNTREALRGRRRT